MSTIEAERTADLGSARPLWDEHLAALPESDVHEWKSSTKNVPPSLRLKRKVRNIVYLGPRQGWLLASFALGPRAMEGARAAKFPAAVVRILDEAKKYPEGTAVRIEVKTAKDVAVVKKLAAIKLAN